MIIGIKSIKWKEVNTYDITLEKITGALNDSFINIHMYDNNLFRKEFSIEIY